jgi:hypothetical protein
LHAYAFLQLLFDAGAAYSIFMTAGFLALGPDFFGRVPLVFLLDFLSIYFTFGVLFDVVTLTSVLITTARLGTTPLAFYDGACASVARCAGGCCQPGASWGTVHTLTVELMHVNHLFCS